MDKYFKHIALAILAVTCGAFLFFTYRIYQSQTQPPEGFGASVTSIATSTVLRDFPAIFNAVVTALNTDKLDSYDVIGGEGVAWASTTFTVSFDCSEVEGTGIDCSGEDITLDATGDWTGTLDTIEGAAFLTENEFLATTTRVSNGGTGLTTLTDTYLMVGNGTTNIELTVSPQLDTVYDRSTGGGTLTLDIVNNASGVNYLALQAGEAGTTVDITTLGSDDNVGLTINTKGTATTTISDHFLVSGNASFGAIASGTWNGSAIADAYVADNITASSYLLLAGGIITGSSTVANDLTVTGTSTLQDLTVSRLLSLPANSVTDAMIPDTLTASNYLLNTSYYGTSTLPAKIATTTGVNGIDISGGCFAIGGTCLASGGSGTVNNGSEGQLAYYAANGTAVSGTSTLFITTDGKLGIGTTTPSGILTVSKTSPAADEILFRVNTSADDSRFSVDEDGDVLMDGALTATNLTSNSQFNALGNGISMNSSAAYIIDSTGSLFLNDTVGIGTSTAYSLLTIWGSGNLLELVDTASTTKFLIDSSGNMTVSGTSTTQDLTVSRLLSLPNDSVTDAMIPNTITASNYIEKTATSSYDKTALYGNCGWKFNMASSSSLLPTLTATGTINLTGMPAAGTVTKMWCQSDSTSAGTSTLYAFGEFLICGSSSVTTDTTISSPTVATTTQYALQFLNSYAGGPKQTTIGILCTWN